MPATAQASQLTGKDAVLKIHNDVRHKHGIAPLHWDATLAEHAKKYAEHLASIEQMVHSSGDQRPGEGENLYAAPSAKTPLQDGAHCWVNEEKNYHGEAIPQGNFESYGHYTQCTWRSTTKVGLGSAVGKNGWVYVVGRYAQPGNFVGQKPY